MKKPRRRERTIGFAQAQRSMQALLRMVEHGHTFRIKRRGKPDARLVRP